MSAIDIAIVVVTAVLFAGAVGLIIYRRVKKGRGCDCGECGGCDCCRGCDACKQKKADDNGL